ncbi:substrate-binding domain-containing protein [Spirillospora sp. NPDC047279]|uniref:sugar ABC transporter substrate-binding protein n=1 Tax=Spirillospora sp. NPDC047279 TaxID=3155478 RepID=UPI0034061962
MTLRCPPALRLVGTASAALILTVATLAGCSTAGSTTSASDGGKKSEAQAKAQAVIDQARALPTFTLDAPAFDVTKARGKTVVNVPITEQIPYVKAVDDEMKRVATRYGVKWTNYQNGGTPTEWSKGIDYGIQVKADLIIAHSGINPEVIIPALQRAKRAGIPVIATHTYQDGERPPASVASLLAGTTTVPFSRSGALQADYVISKSGCDAKPVVITANDLLASKHILKGMREEFAKLCPGLKFGTIDVPVGRWGTSIKPEIQSHLVKNPNTDWVLASFDDQTIPAVAAIQAAGKAGKVRITSYNGTPANVKLIQDGDIFVADMGESINWLAWSVVDQSFRILSDVEPTENGDQRTPIRVIDDTNVNETGKPPNNSDGYGDAYVTGYEKLWKTEG